MRNSIQPREYSRGSGMEGSWYKTDSDGNPHVLNANRNDDGRWVNANWDNLDNRWNDNGAFVFPVAATLFISLPLCWESFLFLSCLANRRAFYQLYPEALIKQCISWFPRFLFPRGSLLKFLKSNFLIAASMYGSFLSCGRKMAQVMSSIVFMNSLSILLPRE
jgi:hypothetical protein